jgi:hypothetical protein
MITYKDSVALAHRLRGMSVAIQAVELFGSVRRNGQGRDADFLILVNDDDLAKRWWQEERESLRTRWPDALHKQVKVVKKLMPLVFAATVHKRRHKKLIAAANILGINLEALADSAGKIPDFDMFLVPAKWRIGTELNIDSMRQITDLVYDKNTLGFIKRAAKDAVNIA